MQNISHPIVVKLASGILLLTGAAAVTYSVVCPVETALAVGPYFFWGGIAAVVLACLVFVATIAK